MYARVLVDVPTRNFTQQHFDYLIPGTLESTVDVGSRVLVPFGGRRVQGFVLEVSEDTEVDSDNIKELLGVTEEAPLLPYELIDIAKWMSQTYDCPLALSVRSMLPSGMRIEGDKRVELLIDASMAVPEASVTMGRRYEDAVPILTALSGGPRTVSELAKVTGDRAKTLRILKTLEDSGIVTMSDVWLPPRVKERVEMRLFAVNNAPAEMSLTGPQQRVLSAVREAAEGIRPSECARYCGCGTSVVKRVIEKGLVELRPIKTQRRPATSQICGYGRVTLTQAQESVLADIYDAIDGSTPRVFVLAGVTGSGKTEVYLRAIRRVLDEGREAIVLVPEISLTPQTVGRFKERFGDSVAVLHSRLSAGERLDEWVRIRSGKVSVAVGARSAIFAPFENLGLIVIDEEHEPSYKQDDDPKYHAVEVARMRADIAGIPLVLGSATPSIESFYQTTTGRYSLLQLDTRVDGSAPPPVTVVDMREELKRGNRSIFSRQMVECLEEGLARGEQAVVFLNRRGFNTFVMCRECGHVMKCPNCDVSLTFHANPPILVCHYCNTTSGIPIHCPECDSRYIKYFGAGTQRIETELSSIFPSARILRMDVDTTGTKDAHSRILGAFSRGEADFLVGTQMIAKGLDFPNVTVVGVIAADTSLNLPDFRSAERTFQLLTQVAGRAGRGIKPGRVVVQTYTPDHYAVEFASKHDYYGFYNHEILVRRSMEMPPFSEMMQLVISGLTEQEVIRTANEVAGSMRIEAAGIQVLGPAPAPLSKIEGRFRWQIVLKTSDLDQFQAAIGILNKYRRNNVKSDIRVVGTIRPVNLL